MTITEDYSVIVREVIGKLTLINKLYFKSPVNSENNFLNFPIFGGPFYGSDKKSYEELTGTPVNNIQQLLSLNNYTTANTKLNFIKTIQYSESSKINTYIPPLNDAPTEYSPILIDSKNAVNINTIKNIGNINEINCLTLLDYSDTAKNIFTNKESVNILESSTNNEIYNFMRGLYTLYNLFDANIWQAYLTNLEDNSLSFFSFKIPTIVKSSSGNTSTYSLSVTTNATIIDNANLMTYLNYVDPTKTLLATILESTTFNPFVARRIIYMWISICNYFISVVLLNNTTDSTKASNVAKLVQLTYSMIVQSNKSVSYNSIQNTSINSNTNLSGEALDSEKYAVQLVMFQKSINYIKTNAISNTINPYNNYAQLISNNYAILNADYISFINEKDNFNKYKYPILKKDYGDANTNQSIIVTAVYNLLKGLNITSADSTNALFITNHQNSTTPTNNYSTVIRKLTDLIYTNNTNARSLGSSIGVFGDLNNAIGEYISFYSDTQDAVNNISKLLSTGKTNLTTIQTLLNGRLSIQKTQQIYEYIAIALFVIFGVMAISIMVIDMDKTKKLYGCIGLIIFSLLNFLGIQILLNSAVFIVTAPTKPLVESFIDTRDPAIIASIPVGNANYINYYNISLLDQVSNYLDNTFTLVTLLETYKAYGNMNASMSKEVSYYNSVVSQLNNAQSKINNIYFASYINTIDVSALLQLFQILTIIIAAFTTGYVLTDSDNLLYIRSWINYTAGILTVFAMIIYLIEVNTRVRTNPSKVYWVSPKNKSLGN